MKAGPSWRLSQHPKGVGLWTPFQRHALGSPRRAGIPALRMNWGDLCGGGSGGPGFDPWVRKIPWRREWQPTPVVLPGESHGQRNLVGYSPWGHKESDTTEWLTCMRGSGGQSRRGRGTCVPNSRSHRRVCAFTLTSYAPGKYPSCNLQIECNPYQKSRVCFVCLHRNWQVDAKIHTRDPEWTKWF